MAAVIGELLGAEALSAISGGAREALPFITHGVSAGLSANAIGRALQLGGMGIRRSYLLQLVKIVRGGFATARVYEAIPEAEVPPSYIFHPAATFTRNPFSYILRVVVQSPTTMLISTRHITIGSPQALSPEQIAEYAELMITNESGNYHEFYVSHSLEEVLVDPRYMP